MVRLWRTHSLIPFPFFLSHQMMRELLEKELQPDSETPSMSDTELIIFSVKVKSSGK